MAQLRTLIMRTLVLLAVAAIATGLPGGRVRTTAAQSPWVLVPNGMPLFHFDGIAPGESGSVTFTVTNPEASPATFNFAVASLQNDDNGCNAPEQAAGDTTCGPGGGELQFDLRIGLTATGGADRPVVTRTLADWPALPVADPVPLAANETRTYRVDYDLPIGSSNMTQSDMVAFVFRLQLDLVGAESASEPPTVLVSATPSLPQTGIDARPIAVLALSTGFVGLGLYRLSVRRRRST
jgi:hypothetical protein